MKREDFDLDPEVIEAILAAERDTAYAEARVPPSGAMWWRAQMRARQEATRSATWPIALVAGVMVACFAGFVVAFAPMLFDWLSTTMPSVARFVPHVHLSSLFASAPAPDAVSAFPVTMRTVIWIGLAAWLVVTPAAVYFILADGERG